MPSAPVQQCDRQLSLHDSMEVGDIVYVKFFGNKKDLFSLVEAKVVCVLGDSWYEVEYPRWKSTLSIFPQTVWFDNILKIGDKVKIIKPEGTKTVTITRIYQHPYCLYFENDIDGIESEDDVFKQMVRYGYSREDEKAREASELERRERMVPAEQNMICVSNVETLKSDTNDQREVQSVEEGWQGYEGWERYQHPDSPLGYRHKASGASVCDAPLSEGKDGWWEFKCAKTDRKYWYNVVTEESRWDKPASRRRRLMSNTPIGRLQELI